MAKASPQGRSNEADYVVVGSGSAGSALAARLAEAGQSVILLEAGKSDEQFLVKKPGMIGPMHSVPEIKSEGRLGLLHDAAGARAQPQDPADPRQGGRRLELGQRHGLRPRQPRQLRLLGGRGQHRLVRRRGQHRLQADGGLGRRRERLPRRRRPDQGHPPLGAGRAVVPVRAGDRRHAGREGPPGLQRRVAGGRQHDAAERRRRPALQRLPRLHPRPRPARRSASRPRCTSPRWSSTTAARPASR